MKKMRTLKLKKISLFAELKSEFKKTRIRTNILTKFISFTERNRRAEFLLEL